MPAKPAKDNRRWFKAVSTVVTAVETIWEEIFSKNNSCTTQWTLSTNVDTPTTVSFEMPTSETAASNPQKMKPGHPDVEIIVPPWQRERYIRFSDETRTTGDTALTNGSQMSFLIFRHFNLGW